MQGGGAKAQSEGKTRFTEREGVRASERGSESERASERRVHFEAVQRGRLRLGFFSPSVNDMLLPAAHLALNLCLKAATVMFDIIAGPHVSKHILHLNVHISSTSALMVVTSPAHRVSHLVPNGFVK